MNKTLEWLGLLAAVALGAGWAAHASTLPAQLPPLRGPLGLGAAWACLLLGLTLAYRAALPEQPSTGRVPRKIAAALLLALLSTQGIRLLTATFLDVATWDHLFYLKRLVPLGLVAFWCAALLPRETRMLARVAGTSRALAPLPHLAVLLAAAAVLVSWADLAFEWSGASATGVTLKSEIIYREAWTANVLILFSAYALVLALTSKIWTALLLVTPCYVMLAMATLIKIRYMHSSVQPVDLVRIPELLPFLGSFAGSGIVVATLAGAGPGPLRCRPGGAGAPACCRWHFCWRFRSRISAPRRCRMTSRPRCRRPTCCSAASESEAASSRKWPDCAVSWSRSSRGCRARLPRHRPATRRPRSPPP
jgi:hypothetical protein